MKKSAVLLLCLCQVLLAAACSDPAAPRLPTPEEERPDPGRDPGRSLDGAVGVVVGSASTFV